mgnify:CR=1 FL=1
MKPFGAAALGITPLPAAPDPLHKQQDPLLGLQVGRPAESPRHAQPAAGAIQDQSAFLLGNTPHTITTRYPI